MTTRKRKWMTQLTVLQCWLALFAAFWLIIGFGIVITSMRGHLSGGEPASVQVGTWLGVVGLAFWASLSGLHKAMAMGGANWKIMLVIAEMFFVVALVGQWLSGVFTFRPEIDFIYIVAAAYAIAMVAVADLYFMIADGHKLRQPQ